MFGSGQDLGFGVNVVAINGFSGPARAIQADANSLNATFQNLSGSVGGAFGNIDAITKQLKSTIDESQARVSAGTGLIAAGVAAMIPVGLGIKFAGEIEQAEIGFATLLGSTKAASEEIQKIRELAAATPFEFPGILAADRALISATGNADQARKIFMALGNVTSAFGQGEDVLVRMAQNMQGIKSSMKATGMDIKQFTNVGIPLWDLMADTTGKSVKQLKDMDITFEMISEALLRAGGAGGKYGNAMEAMSKSINGKFSTLSDEFKNAFAELGKAVMPLLHPIVDLLTMMFRVMGKFAASPFGKFITGVVIGMSALLISIGTFLVVSGLMRGAIAKLSLNLIQMGFTEIGAAFATGGLTGGMAALGTAIWAALAPLLPFIAAIAAVILVGKLMLDNIGKQGHAWEKLKAITGGVIEVFQTWNGTTATMSKETHDNLEKMGILPFFQKLETWVVRGIEFFKAFFAPIGDAFAELETLLEPIGLLFDEIGKLLVLLIPSLGTAAGSTQAFGAVGKVLGEILFVPWTILKGIIWVLGQFIQFVTWVISLISRLVVWFQGLNFTLSGTNDWLMFIVDGFNYMLMPIQMIIDQVGFLIDMFQTLSDKFGLTELLAKIGIISPEDQGGTGNDPGNGNTQGTEDGSDVTDSSQKSNQAKTAMESKRIIDAKNKKDAPQPFVVHTTLEVDKKVLAKVTNEHNAETANRK